MESEDARKSRNTMRWEGIDLVRIRCMTDANSISHHFTKLANPIATGFLTMLRCFRLRFATVEMNSATSEP